MHKAPIAQRPVCFPLPTEHLVLPPEIDRQHFEVARDLSTFVLKVFRMIEMLDLRAKVTVVPGQVIGEQLDGGEGERISVIVTLPPGLYEQWVEACRLPAEPWPMEPVNIRDQRFLDGFWAAVFPANAPLRQRYYVHPEDYVTLRKYGRDVFDLECKATLLKQGFQGVLHAGIGNGPTAEILTRRGVPLGRIFRADVVHDAFFNEDTLFTTGETIQVAP